MREDPIVEEVHRVREQMLDEAGGTLEGLLRALRERRDRGDYADREFIRLPPKQLPSVPRRAVG